MLELVAVSGAVFEIEIKDTKKKNFWVMTSRINRELLLVKAFIKSKQEFDAVNELVLWRRNNRSGRY